MKTFQGTPGEWFVYGDKYPRIESKNTDERIVVTHPTIAVVTSTFINESEYKANARLIASSKELLELVSKYKQDLENGYITPHQKTRFQEINDLLDKTL